MSFSRIAYLDCSTGVSGDKFLGALLDLGKADGLFTPDHLAEIVRSLAPEARLDVRPVLSHGVSATSISVEVADEPPHRHWPEIRSLVANATKLAEPVRETALRVFEALAEAEAAVHGTDVERVHFHEVGATDSIVDVVGVCAGMHALGIERLVASPVAVGSGTVETSHGVLPVPAPATERLLHGVPVTGGPAPGELTTPTGAALVAALASEFGALPAMTLAASGYGAGTRDIGMPNVCRLVLGAPTSGDEISSLEREDVVVLESNIDHISPEELAFAAEELLGDAALDVWQTPIVMKKGRSAVMVSVLAAPDDASRLAERLMALTGTLGVRMHPLQRAVAPRESFELATPWGRVRVKSGASRVRPEHDDVARIAREQGLAYASVVREIIRLAHEPDAVDEP